MLIKYIKFSNNYIYLNILMYFFLILCSVNKIFYNDFYKKKGFSICDWFIKMFYEVIYNKYIIKQIHVFIFNIDR